jgi:hypothetical protein
VAAAVDGESDSRSVVAQLAGQCRIGLQERIVASYVDPDLSGVERLGLCEAKEVVSSEVLFVVECSRGCFSAPEPKRCGVRTDRAEAPRGETREIERPEAAHRDAADCDTVTVCVRARQGSRDRFAKKRCSPLPVATVVPVAVVTAIGEQHNGRTWAEIAERVEERLAQVRIR